MLLIILIQLQFVRAFHKRPLWKNDSLYQNVPMIAFTLCFVLKSKVSSYIPTKGDEFRANPVYLCT